RVLGLKLSEYHTGYRAYSRRFLEAIPFLENSNDFVFDTQVLIQAATFGFKIGEVPAIGRYHADASSVSFKTSTVYGLQTLGALFPEEHHAAVGVLQHVRHGFAQVEFPEPPLVGQAHHDQVGAPLDGLVDERRTGVPRLHQFGLDLQLGGSCELFDLVEDLLAA